MSRRLALSCILVAAIIGGVIEWRQPMLPDSSWLLWVAGRWLDGATLYRDVFEVNPPLAVWLHAPIVWIARLTSIPISTVFRIAVLIWCAGCIALFDALLRRRNARAQLQSAALIAAAAVALILPAAFFGQREHLLLAAAIPWAALMACRMEGMDVPPILAGPAAFLVAVGIALKPSHVGLWIALPILARRRPWWLFPEFWIVALLGAAYLGIVAQWTLYLGYLRQYGAAYFEYHRVGLVSAATGNMLALLALGSCVLAWPVRRRPLTAALLASTIACLIGAVLQAKALRYHYWPADGLALLLLATASPLTRYALAPIATIWLVGVAQFARDGGSGLRRQAADLKASLRGRRPLVLSPTDDAAWLLVSEDRLPWLSSHYCLWWLQMSRGQRRLASLPHWAEQDSILRLTLLPATPPEALLIKERGINVEEWLRQAPQWRKLLSEYRPTGATAGYRVLYHVAR